MVVDDIWDFAMISWPEGIIMGQPTGLPRDIAIYFRD